MGAVGKPYPPNLPPCRGKVAWPKAMTDEGASGDGRDGSKPISFSLLEKETVFGIQRKRGSRGGQVAPNRFSAARLYAPIEVRPRPQWTTPVEQGQAVVLSDIFSPPARVGVGRGAAAWYSLCCGAQRRLFTIHSSLFSLPSICGAYLPGCDHGIQLPLDGGTKQTRGAPRRGAPLLRCYAASAAGSVLLSAAGKRSSYHSSSASPRPERTWSRKAVSSG